MKKIAGFLFFCLILNFAHPNEIIVKPTALVKIKIDSQVRSVISESMIKYYLICDSKEYGKIAIRLPLKNSSSSSTMFFFNNENDFMFKIYLESSAKVYIYRNIADYVELTNYENDVIAYLYTTDYKFNLNDNEIIQKDFLIIKNTKNKEFLILTANYNVDYILDCKGRSDFIFQLIHPYKTDFFEKKEFKIFIDKTAD